MEAPHGVFTGFGNPADPLAFVPFRFDTTDTDGQFPDWQTETIVSRRHIPGGARHVLQIMGNGMAMVTWRVWIESQEAYYRLMSYQNTSQTVVVFRNTQSLAGTEVTRFGTVYVQLPGTMLTAIENTVHAVDGIVECDLTFERPVNLLTRGTDV